VSATLRAAYSFAELAAMIGWPDPRRVERLCEGAGLRLMRASGGEKRPRLLVPLVEFSRAFPDLWASIVLRAQLAGAPLPERVTCEACGAVVEVVEHGHARAAA
jgi:hypothetical protein